MAFDLDQLLKTQRSGDDYALLSQYVNPTFARVLKIIGFDIDYVRGQGAYLYDRQGTRYIDCLAGYGVFSCGRNHPVIRKALQRAMDMDLPNLTKMGVPKLSGLLARKLCELAPGKMQRVFFTNCGAGGVETAIKYARAYTGKQVILHAAKSFHGLTIAALSVNGNAEFRDGFGDMLLGCEQVPLNNLDALRDRLKRGDVAGFIFEPIQGKGVNIPADDYLPKAQELCRSHGALFIADEVQTGMGRTGKWFAVEHWGLEPDIIILSKALSGGYVPIGAVLSRADIHDKVFSSLDRAVVHSTTFGQNDLAMVAGLATIAVMEEEGIVENAAAMGQRFLDKLKPLVGKHQMLKDVRGKGLMIALEFGQPSSAMLKIGWALAHKLDKSLFPQAVVIPMLTDHKVLTQVAGHHIDVVKLLPTLVMTPQDVDDVCAALETTITNLHKFPGPAWQVIKRLGGNALKRSPSGGAAEESNDEEFDRAVAEAQTKA